MTISKEQLVSRLSYDKLNFNESNIFNCNIGQGVQCPEYTIPAELGGGPCRIINLGPGLLSDVGFVGDNILSGKVILESSRYGLMPIDWIGEEYVNNDLVSLINDFKENKFYVDADEIFHASADWDWNFQHFITESFPRIYLLYKVLGDALLEKKIKITVSDFPHVKEILGICFPELNFFYLKRRERLKVKGSCYFVPPVFKNIGEQTIFAIEAMRFLRQSYMNLWNEDFNKPKYKCYFGRKIDPLYAGNDRVILNEQEVTDSLGVLNFKKDHFDGMTNMEKMNLLSTINFAIMPVGANIMNLLFAPIPISIIVILHPIFRPIDWFKNLLIASGAPLVNFNSFDATLLVDENKKIANSPYIVDCQKLTSFIAGLEQEIIA